MEVLELIDRLESLATASKRLPLAHRTLIDPQQILELVDQMRVAVPKDVAEAREIMAMREQIINQALRESQRTKTAAANESQSRVEESEVLKQARQRGDEVIQEAQKKAQRLLDQAQAAARARQAGADEYSQEVLYKLEQEVSNVLATVRHGIETLEARREAAPVRS